MTRYHAFISYSHASDSAFARAFQTGLEQLAKPWNRRRALNVFRDETDLTINPEMADAIYRVIDQSSHFLLPASPLAAGCSSKWSTGSPNGTSEICAGLQPGDRSKRPARG